MQTFNLKEFSDAAKKAWKVLAKQGWRLKHYTWTALTGKEKEFAAGVDFDHDGEIKLNWVTRMDVSDARAISMLEKGSDIQWKTGEYLVDFGNKRIWIDFSQSNRDAAKIFSWLLPRLEKGIPNYQYDLYAEEDQLINKSLRDNPDMKAGLIDAQFDVVDKMSPRNARLLLNLLILQRDSQIAPIRILASLGTKGPEHLPVFEIFRLFVKGAEGNQIDELIKKMAPK